MLVCCGGEVVFSGGFLARAVSRGLRRLEGGFYHPHYVLPLINIVPHRG